MELQELKNNFDKIVEKYKLSDMDKAEKISKFLTSGKKVDAKEFAEAFGMEEKEAESFILFILKGIEYKEQNIDPHSK